MPKRTDIKKILIIGSGPIVIGQACEFDYSGTQACKSIKEDGYQIVLINSNPATIMTDPSLSDRTYIEPIDGDTITDIIKKERPDALLPTIGGQTALNAALELDDMGVLKTYGVEMIGVSVDAIKKSEDRDRFKAAMNTISLKTPESGYVSSWNDAKEIIKTVGFPAIIRPSFTLGGAGGNIAYNQEEFKNYIEWGLSLSPMGQALVEQSVIGWKEFELEVMRDKKDNVVIVCSIENIDPMGVHTGDSITVAPAQTLTDKDYQFLRDASLKIIREIGVETGGSNIQFSINPDNGEVFVIEMNPRVSRSSALASKATGFPIAKIAAKLAVGYTLDEIPNDITKKTPACFEPAIDYCVVKFPRFTFEKFPATDQTLTTQMKSVGEVMSIGRTFKESFQKAVRSLEIDKYGLESIVSSLDEKREQIKRKLSTPNWERMWYIADALRAGMDIDEICSLSKIDPWFIYNIKELIDFEANISGNPALLTQTEELRRAKELGFSDRYISKLLHISEDELRKARLKAGIRPVYKKVDTCAAEFEAHTPYLYSAYEAECEALPTERDKIIILGGGPNRIGQGIEFDYCCVHAALALKEDGFETIMVNCNPETVSTDYDISDKLYFEPLTFEDVSNIIDKEKPIGVIVQFGGQTPLKLAARLEKAGVKIIGTPYDSIDMAEDRQRFKEVLDRLNLLQPDNATAFDEGEAINIADKIGYPVIVRPSYVLGGRAMEIVYDMDSLCRYMKNAVTVSPEHPVLIDKFLEDAIEIDVDAISDGTDTVIGGIMEHIEEAGVHSGDSACSLPPYSVPKEMVDIIRTQTELLAKELNINGLINIQFAIRGDKVYILEVNPRASRTIPFVSKVIGVSLAKIAARVMTGKTLKELNFTKEVRPDYFGVKEAVFPFIKFPNVDTLLGPEMKSTGEVMGIDKSFGRAFAKSQTGVNSPLPASGMVFISVKDSDKSHAVKIASCFISMGFSVAATSGTAKAIRKEGIPAKTVKKVLEGRPHIVDHIKDRDIALVINTTRGAQSILDSYSLRRESLIQNVPYCTTIPGAYAAARGIEAVKDDNLSVQALQDFYSYNKNN